MDLKKHGDAPNSESIEDQASSRYQGVAPGLLVYRAFVRLEAPMPIEQEIGYRARERPACCRSDVPDMGDFRQRKEQAKIHRRRERGGDLRPAKRRQKRRTFRARRREVRVVVRFDGQLPNNSGQSARI